MSLFTLLHSILSDVFLLLQHAPANVLFSLRYLAEQDRTRCISVLSNIGALLLGI